MSAEETARIDGHFVVVGKVGDPLNPFGEEVVHDETDERFCLTVLEGDRNFGLPQDYSIPSHPNLMTVSGRNRVPGHLDYLISDVNRDAPSPSG